MEPPSPTEAPPPAYELEHDFDRKISDALDRSLTVSQQAQQAPSIPPGEDEWEEWDETRFEAAAATARTREQGGEAEESVPPISHRSSEKERLARHEALQADHASEYASSSTSSAPVAEPSRRLPTSPPAKERPSWYSEAQLDTPAGSGSGESSQPLPPTPQFHDIPPEEDDPDEPLPPFAAVGPSLEGPPFEEVVRLPPRVPPISNVDSPPQSPLDSVESDSPSELQPYSPPLPSHETYTEPVHTMPPRQSQAPSVPRLMQVPVSSTRPPPMRFDPSMAYAKHRNVNLSISEAESREPVDASALYNSAVSSLLSSQNPKRKNTTHNKDPPAGPATTRPESYGPQSPSQSLSSAPPVPLPAPVPVQSPAQYGAPNGYYPMQQNQGYVPNQYSPQRPLPHPQPTHHQHPQPPHLQHPQPPHPQHPQPPHLQHPQPPHPQHPQQVAPGFYAPPFHAVPQGGPPPPPPPPPTQWYPPHNMTGGGYRR